MHQLCIAFVAAIFAAAMLQAAAVYAAEPDSHVLLVGIGRYADDDDFSLSELKYSHNDIEIIKTLLPALDGFKNPEIVVLWEQDAVKPKIAEQLEAIAANLGAHPERSALVYFSGHGIEYPDVEPLDEADGWDEAFVPYDYPLEKSPPTKEKVDEYLLADDFMAEYFSNLPECRRLSLLRTLATAAGCRRTGWPAKTTPSASVRHTWRSAAWSPAKASCWS